MPKALRQLTTGLCSLCGTAVSGDHIEHGLCDSCREELRTSPGPFSIAPTQEIHDSDTPEPWVMCAHEYAGLTLRLIERMKLAGDTRLAAVAASTLLRPILETVSLEPSAATRSSVLVPIPASRDGRRRRGFDQSLLLAKALERTGIAAVQPVLHRRGGSDQKHLDRADRFSNIVNQLELRPGASLSAEVSVVLVDDVVTTGASMLAARSLLVEAGAQRCVGIALAFRT